MSIEFQPAVWKILYFVERKAFSNLTGCLVNRDPYLYLGVIFYVTDVSLLEDEVKLLYFLPPPPTPIFTSILTLYSADFFKNSFMPRFFCMFSCLN